MPLHKKHLKPGGIRNRRDSESPLLPPYAFPFPSIKGILHAVRMPYAHGFHASLRKTQHSTQKKRTTSPARSASIILYVPHILKQTPQPELKAQGRIRRIPLLKAISCCFYIVTILLPAYSARAVIPLSSRTAHFQATALSPCLHQQQCFLPLSPESSALRPCAVLTDPISVPPGLYGLPPSAAFSPHPALPGYTFKAGC